MADYLGIPLEERGIVTRVVKVTPNIARDWLKHNTHNRTPKPAAQRRYARDMETGNWTLTGEPIIFDSNGTLLNGQNRLMAAEGANVEFDSVVMWGVAADAFTNMDRGVLRSVGDVFGLSGEENPIILAAAVRLAMGQVLGHTFTSAERKPVTAAEEMTFLEKNPDLRMAVARAIEIRNSATINLGISKPLIAYAYWRLSKIHQDQADEFFESLFTQSYNNKGLDPGHPCKALGSTLVNGHANRRKMRPDHYAAYIFRTWNKFRKGEMDVQQVKVSVSNPGSRKERVTPVEPR